MLVAACQNLAIVNLGCTDRDGEEGGAETGMEVLLGKICRDPVGIEIIPQENAG